jgi:MoxR-like ATPase
MPQFTPEQREQWRAEQKVKPKWRPFYGWRHMPVFEKSPIISDVKPKLVGFTRQFSHPRGSLLIGPPKRSRAVRQMRNESARLKREAEAAGQHYIVFEDRSLRSISKSDFNALSKVPVGTRVAVWKSGSVELEKAA